MKYIVFALCLVVFALCLAAPAFAAERYFPKSGITVSLAPPPALPSFTATMTPDDFAAWAIQTNQAAAEANLLRHLEIKQQVGDLTLRGTLTTTTSKLKSRLGGGVGYNGFGGEGGYAGYNQYNSTSNFGFNYGYGFSNPGNARQADEESTTLTHEMIWEDRNHYGGPLTIINPYCPPKH